MQINMTTLFIKNMVCNRCIMVVQNELDKLSSKLSKPIDHRLKMVMIFFNKDMSLPEFTEGENILLIYADKAKDRFRKYPKAEHSFSDYQELIEYLGKK